MLSSGILSLLVLGLLCVGEVAHCTPRILLLPSSCLLCRSCPLTGEIGLHAVF